MWMDKRMSVEKTKAYDITTTMVSAKFDNLEATKPFFSKEVLL